MKCKILLTVLTLFFVSTSVFSSDSNADIKLDKKQINNAIVAFNNLSLEIDFWHDATLKGNNKAIVEHRNMIYDIISDDIKENHQSISYAKLDASYLKDESKANDDKKIQSNLKHDESIFKTKKLLFSSLKKSSSFAYSYRLLADYLQILKNEIDAHKINIAGDDSKIDQDAGQVRKIK